MQKLCIVGSRLEGPVVCEDWFLFCSIRYGKIAKGLSQLDVKKSQNRKMSIPIRYGKIAKFLSQLGLKKM